MTRTVPASTTRAAVLGEVGVERARQDARWGVQDHPSGTGQAFDDELARDAAQLACQDAFEGGYGTWRHILHEEVAEAFAEAAPARLRSELVQVAAVAVAWIEALDRDDTPEGVGTR